MSPFTSFRDAPIRRKLMLISLLISGVALLAVSLILAASGWLEWRTRTISEMTTYAEVVGRNAASAMLFEDRNAAAETLAALSANPDIVDAVIYDKSGRLFARFTVPAHSPSAPMPSLEPGTYLFSLNQLVVSEPIRFKDEVLGAIYLESDLRELYADILRNTALTFIAALGVFLASIFLFARMQKVIVGPILDLSEGMRKIAAEQNYAIRVAVPAKDEIGMLARTFNDMLIRIQQRDQELERHRGRLEEEVARRTAKLTEAQRIAHLGNWEWDIATNTLDWSDEIYRIFGLAPHEFGATYQAFLNAVHPDDRQSVETHLRDALERGVPYSIDHRIVKPDGSIRYVHEQAEIFRDDSGRSVKMVGTVHDITEGKLAQDQVRASLAEKEVLLQEIHHRVKNNLQIVISLLRLQSRKITDKFYQVLLNEIQDRIRVMSLIHEKLYRSADFTKIGFKDYIKSLAEGLMSTYGANQGRVVLEIDAVAVFLEIDKAIPCGLIINELITNAIKYAFPGDRKGKISIILRQVADDEIELFVRDNGIGLPAELDIRKSPTMGMQLVTSLAEDQLKGELELERLEGTGFRIRFRTK